MLSPKHRTSHFVARRAAWCALNLQLVAMLVVKSASSCRRTDASAAATSPSMPIRPQGHAPRRGRGGGSPMAASELEVDELAAAELARQDEGVEARRVEARPHVPRGPEDHVEVVAEVLHQLHDQQRQD